MAAVTSLITELQEAADRAAKGIRDAETMRKASENLDSARESTRQRVGMLEVAVDLIREARE
jgi:hypothetical protein